MRIRPFCTIRIRKNFFFLFSQFSGEYFTFFRLKNQHLKISDENRVIRKKFTAWFTGRTRIQCFNSDLLDPDPVKNGSLFMLKCAPCRWALLAASRAPAARVSWAGWPAPSGSRRADSWTWCPRAECARGSWGCRRWRPGRHIAHRGTAHPAQQITFYFYFISKLGTLLQNLKM